MALKTCRVTCSTSQGIYHTVEVTAETLYEAVAQALRLFRENDWSDDVQRVPATMIVRVKQPEMEHRVRTRDFEKRLALRLEAPPRWH
jgi:type II secretory pathway predicted ATPase ExeA